MMDVTFNGTAPLRLSIVKGRVQLEITTESGSRITSTMHRDEALALSDVLIRMAHGVLA